MDLPGIIPDRKVITFIRLYGAALDPDGNKAVPGIKTAYTAYPDTIFARIFT